MTHEYGFILPHGMVQQRTQHNSSNPPVPAIPTTAKVALSCKELILASLSIFHYIVYRNNGPFAQNNSSTARRKSKKLHRPEEKN